MEELVIRKAEKEDAQEIAALLSKSQWFTYKNLFTAAYIHRMIKQYYNVERISDEIVCITEMWNGYYIAIKKNRIIGVIGGGMIDEMIGEVYVLYLEPSLRGCGVGSRLLEYYTKIQKHTYGAQEQWVSVAKGNNYGIPFYIAKGFEFQYEELSYGSTEKDQDISLKFRRCI